MKIAEYSIKNRNFINFVTVLIVFGGIWAYTRVGKLEDPEFTVKTALVVTLYPGANPMEVEKQVTEPLERAVQQLSYLNHVRSISKSGISYIYVDIKESYRTRDMHQIWDELRRKINDAKVTLPPGVLPPIVKDDYGDVFGVFLALHGTDYSLAELEDYAELIQRELLQVKDVSKVEISGEQKECINIKFSRAKLAELDIRPDRLFELLVMYNTVVNPGAVDIGSEYVRLRPTGVFKHVDDIGDLVVHGGNTDDMVLLRDVATISREYVDPPTNSMRFNGEKAIGIAVSTVSGGNVVTMGEAAKKRLNSILKELPAGLHINYVSLQSDTVKEAINGFVLNLIESVAIVVAVLLLTMGLRSGLIIGSGLILTILATIIVMLLWKIDMQRTSLASLIIAMGMLVDNSIVVTEGSLIRMQRGENLLKASIKPVQEAGWPLLGATIVAILAFLPIYITGDDTGEYCESLFLVVAISLAISWFFCVTSTPVLCYMFLKVNPKNQGKDPYAGVSYRIYHAILKAALHHRIITLSIMIAALMTSMWGFSFVKKMFFPEANRTQFMVDYWLPEGSRIQNVSEDLKQVETYLKKLEKVSSYATCIGAGAPRFYLPYTPELPNQSFGQIIVNVKTEEDVGALIPKVETYMKSNFPQAEPRVRRFPLGPSNTFKIELRISGRNTKVLKQLAEQAKRIIKKHPFTKDTRDNWRQQVKNWVPVISQPKLRRSMVTRKGVALALKRLTTGINVGDYRENDELIPIQIRAPEPERLDLNNLKNVPLWGMLKNSVPLSQVVSKFNVEWEDPIIMRRDRQRTITVQCSPDGANADKVRQELAAEMAKIKLPPGYIMEWGGDFEDSSESQANVLAQLPLAMILMALVVVWLFNRFKQPLIIALTVPFAVIGVVVGLLVMDMPFGFMALLGTLSLIGMLIKNAVVLLDQIDIEIKEGKAPYAALVDSSISRMRPVLMASLTTVFGMLPLIWDTLFKSMAVSIMFGLSFATVLTLIIVPVLYSLFYKVQPTE